MGHYSIKNVGGETVLVFCVSADDALCLLKKHENNIIIMLLKY